MFAFKFYLMNSALSCSGRDITWYFSHAIFVVLTLYVRVFVQSVLCTCLENTEVGRWYDVISLFCKTWCA
jgi:hypothetical protein